MVTALAGPCAIAHAGALVGGVGPAAAKVYSGKMGVSLGGYGEALYQNFARKDQSGAPSGKDDQVTLLRAVVYLGYKFGGLAIGIGAATAVALGAWLYERRRNRPGLLARLTLLVIVAVQRHIVGLVRDRQVGVDAFVGSELWQEILLDSRTRSRPFWRAKYLEKIVKDHLAGVGNHTLEIHKVLAVELLQRLLLEQN